MSVSIVSSVSLSPSVAVVRAAPPALAPLSAAEMALAIQILRAELALPAGLHYRGIAPPRPTSEAGASGLPVLATDRDVVVIVNDPEIGTVSEAVVAIDDGFVRSYRRVRYPH